ncbi:hypothetical protein ACFRAO_43845 [Streptomyces sp. NPDC056656]|uniref:hypothetical protein n=1 Tax=Streptomyces sp. NPDC056656 TaxID=3345895 RepID=UPI0036AC60A8
MSQLDRDLEALGPTRPLEDIPGVQSIAYGVVRPEPDPLGVPMIGATEVMDGDVIDTVPRRIAPHLADRHPRTQLTEGDLLVVLVGRVGETAVATQRHTGWNVARPVAVIRCTPQARAEGVDVWLRWWLKTPHIRRYVQASSTNSEHVTLPLQALKRLPVWLPPQGAERTRHLHTITLAQRRLALNAQIARCATELADAHFTRACPDPAHALATRPIGETGRVATGSVRCDAAEHLQEIAFAAAKEVLNSPTAHLQETAAQTWVAPDAACPPGTLLVAPRPGEVRTVLSTTPVAPARGVLAICTETETDRLWLLHALRAASRDLMTTAQGEAARAMRRKAFSRFLVPWPSQGVREDFARIASPLHDVVRAVTAEQSELQDVVTDEMTRRSERDR